MASRSLVSIIIPTYNHGRYISDAIQSVLLQTYTDWECVIVDDGSQDNTEDVVKDLIKDDVRFNYLKKENGGVSKARNFGIKRSKGEYILPLDGDDKIGDQYLQLALDAFSKNRRLKVVYCKAQFFGIEEGEWGLPEYSYQELLLNNSIFCSGIYRREDYNRTGGYDEQLIYGGEDWEFWISLLKEGGEVLRLDSVQFYYRKLESSRSKQVEGNREKDIYCRNAIFMKHFDIYQKHFADPLTIYNEAYHLKKQVKAINNSRSYKVLNRLWQIGRGLGF